MWEGKGAVQLHYKGLMPDLKKSLGDVEKDHPCDFFLLVEAFDYVICDSSYLLRC